MDLTNVIKTIELEEYSTPPGIGPIAFSETGFVDGGSLVSFSSVTNQQRKKDVLNSTLLSQLAANKKYNRFTNPSDWYAFYRKVASEVGWVTQSFKPFERYASFPNEFTISDVVINAFSGALKVDEGEKRALKDTIESLEKSKSALTLFESNSIESNRGNFQILACTVDKNEQVSVSHLGCYFQSTEIKDNYFFAKREKQDITLQMSAEVLILNEDVYDQVREEVNQKLGNRVTRFLSHLNL